MTDYCLKNADEAEFNQLMLDTGLCVEVTDGEGEDAVTTVVPADHMVLIDRIGQIKTQIRVTKKGTPVYSTATDYHVNLRILGALTEDQMTALEPYIVDTPQTPYRTWA